ncbi:hypothetical protein ONZ45_g5177 [Pleurotus djamor]|nr:hypothetical protein ONZ45_g5177 [Pleurotus djamor]
MQALDPTVGAVEVGILLSTFLSGFATIQTYEYFSNYCGDSKRLKVYTSMIWILDIAFTTLLFHALYIITVSNYGQPGTVNTVPPTLSSGLVVTSISIPLVQAFFVNRVRIMSNSAPIIAFSSSAVLFLRFATSFACSIVSFIHNNFSELRSRWNWLFILTLSIGFFCDAFVAASSCFFLLRRKRDPFPTDTLLNILRNRNTHMVIARWLLFPGTLSEDYIMQCRILPDSDLRKPTFPLRFPSPSIVFIIARSVAWITTLIVTPKIFTNILFATLNARAPHTTIHERKPSQIVISPLAYPGPKSRHSLLAETSHTPTPPRFSATPETMVNTNDDGGDNRIGTDHLNLSDIDLMHSSRPRSST